MKFTGLVKRLLVGVAILSTTISTSPAIASGLALPANEKAVQDISLGEGGVFRGHVMTTDGQPVVNTRVVLQQDNRRVAETVSDKDGRFAFQGIAGGSYLVSTDKSASAYRLWASQTAPPAARTAALVVNNGEIVRGNFGGMGVTGVVVTTLAVAGITWGVIEIIDKGSD